VLPDEVPHGDAELGHGDEPLGHVVEDDDVGRGLETIVSNNAR
jgi:hypothetical protein